MKTRTILHLASAGFALISSCHAWAQSAPQDVIIMRRTIAPPANPGQTAIQPLPENIYTYDWVVGPAGPWDSNCSASATASREVRCVRSDEADAVAENCDATTKPSSTVTGEVYSGCATHWVTEEWSEWDSQCSGTATRQRNVECGQIRPEPQGVVPTVSDACDAATMPAASETTANYSNCPASWQIGSWGWDGVNGAMSSTCSATPQQIRTVTCEQIDTTGTLVTVADGLCPAPKPETSQTLPANYGGCAYYWDEGAWGVWDSQCSETAHRTRTVVCRREDSTLSDDSYCPTPKPSTEETAPNVVNCSGILANNGFESGLTGWINAGGQVVTDSKVGAKAVKLTDAGTSVRQNLSNTGYRTYTLTFWCKGGQVGIITNTAEIPMSCGGASYAQISRSITSNPSGYLKLSNRIGGVTIDDVVLMEN